MTTRRGFAAGTMIGLVCGVLTGQALPLRATKITDRELTAMIGEARARYQRQPNDWASRFLLGMYLTRAKLVGADGIDWKEPLRLLEDAEDTAATDRDRERCRYWASICLAGLSNSERDPAAGR